MEPNIARLLLKPNNEDKNRDIISFPSCQFEPSMLVDMFPGPALLVDGNMNVKHHNIFAKGLLGPIHDHEAFLKSMISRCLSNICPDTQKATLDDSSGLRHYDLYAFPIKQEQSQNTAKIVPLVFLFGRETTVEHNLTNALVDSRQMFKDLVSCSTDFAWETDSNGNFIYVSPKGILGYTAYELNGKNAQEMIIGAETRNPFDTLDKVTEMELWLKRADGSMACLLVSAVPVLDSHAKWQGARGVCRDITHIREKEALLRRTNKREHILNKIISTIRNITTPADMMENALKAAMEGIKADYGCIMEKTSGTNGRFTAAVRQEQGILSDQDLVYTLCQKALEIWQNSKKSISKAQAAHQTFQLGTQQVLMGITSHHAKDNGAIFLIRQNGDWQDDEIHLFSGITSHLGIAIEQVITHKELERRAFTDELTGQLNRRAFTTEVTKRIKGQTRSRTTGALLYIDLDNFKNVNDTKGHAHGDRILKELARIINENIRIGDYSARLGGDEFAIWLDDVTEADALFKARKFIAAGSQLAQIADVAGPQLSISVGLALCQPDNPQTFDDLMKNSDDALYQAKSAGKATCVIYNPNAPLIAGQQKEESNA
ncbi:MAG: diguanylate cyclase [Emcibacter sp.]|nr:diguanylate cyclase [Emcibacter sp.]